MPDKFVILACDGGGIRGLSSAVILANLEARLSKPLHDRQYFGLIAGTSTGSIIACGIASGKRASEIKDLYYKEGINIFPEAKITIPHFLGRIFDPNFSEPIYQDVFPDNKGINKVLQKILGADAKFGDLKVPTLATSYDTLNQHFVTFNSRYEEFKDINTWEVIRASSAAPVAFPAYLIKNDKFIQFWKKYWKKEEDIEIQTISDNGQECIPLVDGGLAANNPTMCAITERLSWANKKIDISDIVVVSIGTGLNPNPDSDDKFSSKQLTPEEARGWGALEWISPRRDIPILRALFDGSADATDTQAKQILSDDNYFRFQPQFSDNYQAFNANEGKLIALINDTENYLKDPKTDNALSRLVNLLEGE